MANVFKIKIDSECGLTFKAVVSYSDGSNVKETVLNQDGAEFDFIPRADKTNYDMFGNATTLSDELQFKIIPDNDGEITSIDGEFSTFNNVNYNYVKTVFDLDGNIFKTRKITKNEVAPSNQTTFTTVCQINSNVFNFVIPNYSNVIFKAINSFDGLNPIETVLEGENPSFEFSPRDDIEKYDMFGDVVYIEDSLIFTIEPVEGKQIKSVDGVISLLGDETREVIFSGNELKYSSDSIGKNEIQQGTTNLTIDFEGSGTGETLSTPFTNSYIVTGQDLADIQKFIFLDVDGTKISKSDFVNNLLELPFNLEEFTDKYETSQIYFGVNSSTVEGEKLLFNNIKIDLGEIDIPRLFDNSLDLELELELVVPFTQKRFSLDSNRCVGNKITLEMVLDVFTGNTTLNVLIGENVLISEGIKIGKEIPFQEDKFTISTGLVDNSGVINDIKNCYVEIKKPVLETQYNSNLVNKTGSVLNGNGYVISDNFKISGLSLKDSTELMSIFSQGVYND